VGGEDNSPSSSATKEPEKRISPELGQSPKDAAEDKQNVEEFSKLKAALLEERNRAEDYLNKLRYLQADFENYRKRAQREIEEVAMIGQERLVLGLLGIWDELDLALRAGDRTENKQALMEGVRVTLRKLSDLLRSEGVVTIEATGKPFDPELHEVVSTIPRKDCQKPLVLEEIRKGFIMKGRVIRPSVVTVATPTSPLQVKEEKPTPLTVAGEPKTLSIKEKEKKTSERKSEGE